MEVRRGEVYLMALDPVVGHEVGKPRPCIVVSPDELNARAGTFVVVPMSSRRHDYPTRVHCEFRGRAAEAQLDQIRTLSPLRIISKIGELRNGDLDRVLDRLSEMFAP